MGIKIDRYRSLEEAGEHNDFYAINNSDEGGQREKGKLLFVLTAEDGTTQSVMLPPSWIPINLLHFADKATLLRSSALRTYVGRKLIILAKKASVDTLMALPEYASEYDRVKSIMSSLALEEGTADISISTNRKSDVSAVVESILTAPNETVVSEFNKYRLKLSDEDLRLIASNSVTGSFHYELALEWEGIPPVERLVAEQTEAYGVATASGKLTAPKLEF